MADLGTLQQFLAGSQVDDEVFAQACLTHGGQIKHEPTRKVLEGANS